MERSGTPVTPNQEHVPAKHMTNGEALVKKVWVGIGKAVESQRPKAWKERIIRVINDKIIPKLNQEQLAWVASHKRIIETSAMVAGVGITATEITLATILTEKMYRSFRKAIEERNLRRIRSKSVERQKIIKPSGPVKVADVQYNLNPPVKFYTTPPDPFMVAEMAADPKWKNTPSNIELFGKPDEQWFEAITNPGVQLARDIEEKFAVWQKRNKVNEAHRLARTGRMMGQKLERIQVKGEKKRADVIARVKKVRETRAELSRLARENMQSIRLSNDSGFRVGMILEEAMKKKGNVSESSQVWLKHIIAKTGELADSRDPKVLSFLRDINGITGDTIYDRVEKSGIATRLFEYVFKKLPSDQRTSGGFHRIDHTMFSTMASQLVQSIHPKIFESFKRSI